VALIGKKNTYYAYLLRSLRARVRLRKRIIYYAFCALIRGITRVESKYRRGEKKNIHDSSTIKKERERESISPER